MPILPYLALGVQKGAHKVAVNAHTIAAYLMITLLVPHVLAALKHQFIGRLPQFRRMGVG